MGRTLLLVLLGLVLAGCAVSPTGRQQLLMVSSQQLDSMGAQAFQQMKTSMPLDRERGVNRYVRCVADAMIAEIRTGPRQWEVRVFADEAVNAFALPGGKIGVYTGLLAVARDQDQLAAVMGHEIGHVLAQHANERVSQELLVQGGMAAVGSVAGSRGLSPELVQALGLGAQIGVLLPFSRTHESEADAIGLDLMARAGFDPRASVQLWLTMAKASGGQPPELLSTHPAHGTRIRGLEAQLPTAMRTFEMALSMGKRPDCERLK